VYVFQEVSIASRIECMETECFRNLLSYRRMRVNTKLYQNIYMRIIFDFDLYRFNRHCAIIHNERTPWITTKNRVNVDDQHMSHIGSWIYYRLFMAINSQFIRYRFGSWCTKKNRSVMAITRELPSIWSTLLYEDERFHNSRRGM
jgi:hypothetical protein